MYGTFAIIFGLIACVIGHGQNDPKDIAADPAHPWIGRWESIDGRHENFENFIKHLGLAHYGADNKVYHKFWKEDDHFHHGIAVTEKDFKKFVEFKLGEEGTLTWNNTEFKYKYTEENKDLHVEVKVPAKDKVVHDTYHVEGEQLVKTYKVDNVEAKRWFAKATSKPSNT
ncbi:secretory-abundant heat soluble protein 1-like [Paramacrobiotus metropolitanus]|uniref:secretory-abundant heat soluble protein 1-like n=1 Tax=Paramacrobiotus metropolitanus TaxID=2943436 RepID=UPI0024460E68|nr:secretory-abundant heat soluble protein 1-like [Paramacrobiotus metropolitanus]